MKIGFVLDDGLDAPDGVQRYILTLGEWLVSAGHEVHYLVGETHRHDLTNVWSLSRNLSVKFNHNRMTIPLPASRQKLRNLLYSEQFDVLHVQMPYSPWLAGRLVRLAGPCTAIIGTFHIVPYGRIEKWATRLLRFIVARSIGRFDRIVAVSQPAAEFAANSFRLKSQIIPNAVDTKRFAQSKKSLLSSHQLRIVFLGRLVERKGCMKLLQALRILHEQRKLTGVAVIIAGAGPLEHALRSFVDQYGMQSLVEFRGFVNEADKTSLLRNAEIAVFPSTGGESFGIVLIEAMAAGSSVVLAGDNPGYHSVMHERPKQLVDPTNSIVFAQRLLYYIENPDARKETEIWQRQCIMRFDIAIVGNQIVNLYIEALHSLPNVR